jgi:hypothetical protein
MKQIDEFTEMIITKFTILHPLFHYCSEKYVFECVGAVIVLCKSLESYCIILQDEA